MSEKKIPFFTIILTTYNRLDYLREAVDSVICQTFKNWNLHIVDNSSSDGTREFLEDLIRENNRIKFSNINNNGIIATSRNFGINEACSRAISFLDDDDVWYPKKLENDYQILSKKEGLVYSKCHSFSDRSKLIRKLPNRRIPLNSPLYDLFHYGNIFTTSTVSYTLNNLTKKEKFNESNFLRTWEDYEFWIRLIRNCKLNPYCTFKYGARYRISNQQNSSPLQDIKNANSISLYLRDEFMQHKLIRIKNLPLWAHYSNMNSFIKLGKYKKSLKSFFYICIISLRKRDLLYLFKSLIKYIFLIIKYR